MGLSAVNNLIIDEVNYEIARRISYVASTHTYPTGLKVTDEKLAALNLFRDAFHGEWNYTIKPQGR